MVSSITGSQSSNVLARFSSQQTTPSGSTASFTDQLATALEGYLAQSGNGSNLQIDIQTTQSQVSGVRQFLVTVKNPDSPTGQAAAAASGSTSVSVASPSETTVTPVANPMAEIDAYWAAQPEEVQQLRKVADFGQRSALAQQLAEQGYSVDRAVMVWGWDPLKTMLTRKMYGYTWVPNFNQATPSCGPNISLPGQTPYDPNSPPPNSIAVNTDFANGLDIGDPWA